ncbi:hypothetical protein FGO68_gene6142 [Halteria grandinella]|uniref:Ubiquinone biosynthesis protein n=1 Tax=Halteria grandinella TaxID=5974 RepID=A0A8J8T0A4_HALGN|nr:hypothetical protein FGO68_gene6142 [Halteria grandinella]
MNSAIYRMNVSDRLKIGIKTRLSYVIPYIEKWPQAMYLGIDPKNISNTVVQIHQISDEIWYISGDKSVDYTWYTKRALLSGLYASTELFMIGDRSKGQEATWEFLDRRVDDVVSAGQNINFTRNFLSAVSIGVNSIATILKPYKFDDSEMRRMQAEAILRQKEQTANNKEQQK